MKTGASLCITNESEEAVKEEICTDGGSMRGSRGSASDGEAKSAQKEGELVEHDQSE